VRAAAATFTVGFLDDARSPIVCAADGSDCVADFQFPDTTRLYIDVPPTYAVNIEIAPVRAGVCKTNNDAYISLLPFANNSLAGFKAVVAGPLVGKDQPDGILLASMTNCIATSKVNRVNIGIYQSDNGWIGNCPIGHFRLRLGDASHRCDYRRADLQCYEGDLACRYARSNATVRRDFPLGEPVRCCPAKQPGQSDSVLTTLSCTCAGLDHAPSAPVPAPAGTCQTGAFCVGKCGITGGISAGGVSYGSCCADCSATDLSLSGGGRCTNSCPAFGGGSVPSPTLPPSPTLRPSPTLAPQWPQPTAAPLQTTVSTTDCDNCNCARTGCETRCMANGGGTVLNFVCNSVNGILSVICECQQAAASTSDAVSHHSLTALFSLAVLSRVL
jgi:hypothetical protein